MTGIAARRRACDVVRAYLDGERDRVSDLPPSGSDRDAALTRELAEGAVRYARLYDHLAARFLHRGDPPPALKAALRIGAHQLFGLDRVPVHAAVATTVGALKALTGGRYAGPTNAVLRRLAEWRVDSDSDSEALGPLRRLARAQWPQDLALRHSLPDALLAHCDHRQDDRRLAGLSQASLLCTRLFAEHDLAAHPAVARSEGPWLWWSDPRAAIEEVVTPGLGVVQDRTQGLAIEMAAPLRGERVLDLCAAPGGKSAYLRDLGASLMASDRNRRKVRRLARAVPGCCLVQDGRRPAVAARAFDLVVVDAPCSNSGVFGRRPEAKARYDAQALESLRGVQADLLAAAAPLVAPGGRLLYATCSVADPENHMPAVVLDGWECRAERSTWPDLWHGGGYAAVWQRPA